MTPATERALSVEGGVWMAMNERTCATLWPRCLYPSADGALTAAAEWAEWCEEDRVRLTWAVPTSDIPGYWIWGDEYRDSWESIECWEVTP